MKKGVLFAIVFVWIVLLLFVSVSASPISSCQNITSSGIYTLTQNVSSSATCMNITEVNVILDCNGHTINFSGSSTGYGVSSNSSNTTVENCVIRQTARTESSYGIYFSGVNNSIIDNCNVFTNGKDSWDNPSHGIYFENSNYNTVTNTNTTSGIGASGDRTDGLYLVSSDYNNVTNYNEIGGYEGVTLADSNYNNFFNSSSIALIDNFFITYYSSYNNFTNCYLGSLYSTGLLFYTGDKNSFINSVITGFRSIYLASYTVAEVNFTNCTVDSLVIFEEGSPALLNFFEYADVYVSDIGGNPINNANVSVYNNEEQLVLTSSTNSSGYTQRLTIQGSMQNATSTYSRTPHNFTAIATGYRFNSTSIDLTTNFIDYNKVFFRLLSEGNNPATTILNSPINTYKSGYSSITFNCTGSDDFNLKNVTLYGNWTGSWQANETNSSPINSIPTIFTKTISEGYYSWNCRACDNSSSCSFALANRTFRIETSPPIAEQGINPINNYNSTSSDITFDFKCSSDVPVSSIQLWTNTTGSWASVYSNNSYANNTWLNITINGISDLQNYNWAVYCNDSEGKSDWTSNRTFDIETGSNLVSFCRTLDEASTIYSLSQNISSSGTCINITAEGVTLDCKGYTLTFSTSSTGDGIYSDLDGTTIKNCTIRQGTQTFRSNGIKFFQVNNGLIDNNKIYVNGAENYGIYLRMSNYNQITNTNTTASGAFNYGTYAYYSSYNNVTNYRDNGNSGFALESSHYNNFVNATIIVPKYSLSIIEFATNNNFIDGYFESSYYSALDGGYSDHNSFFNSVLTGPESIHAGIYSGEINFTNCTLNGDITVHAGQLNRFWYADVYVNGSLGASLEGANVTAKNVNNVLKNWSLTNSSGYIQRAALRQYMQNSTGTYYDTNYTFLASKEGYAEDSNIINLTTNYILPSNYIWITMTDSNALTALFGTNPINNYNSDSQDITFDFKCSYNSTVDTIQLWTNTTGIWHANYTNSSYQNNTWINITVLGIPEAQNYKWAVYCNASGSSDWTINRTVTVTITDINPPSAPPAGGGGGGGGGGAPAATNTTNVTNTTQVNIIPNNNPSNGNGNQIGSKSSSSSESAGAAAGSTGHGTDLTWLWTVIGILIFSGILTLILVMARKKKDIYHKNIQHKKIQRY